MGLSEFQESAARAAALVRSRPAGTRWFLACDSDADGLCAAAVTAAALLKVGHRFTVRASRDKTIAAYAALAAEDCDGYVVLDKGTSHLAQLADLSRASGRPVLVVDHHNLAEDVPPLPTTVAMLNPRASGLDGSRDASAATTAVALAVALCGDAAYAWGPIGLSGAIGDWQHMGGWKGWNLALLERSMALGHVKVVVQPAFIAVTLAEAIARFQPALPGLHGDPQAAVAFVRSLGLDTEAEVEDLTPEQQARLVSACTLRLLAAGDDGAKAARLVLPTEHSIRLGTSLRHCFRVVDACGRMGQTGTGVAFLLGDKAARADAVACFQQYRQALAAGVRRLRDEGTRPLRAVQVAWTEDPAYTGMVAGIGMTHVLSDRRRPVAVLAKREDGQVQASTRGLEEQVAAGMDLGRACSAAASSVGSEGGGHPIAAGAVVPAAKADAFLAALDEALVRQAFLHARTGRPVEAEA
ncbi:MAG TPA: DHHA1 domain-containing protein [Candidatus Thermoplasmatota archaeon]|nr:DHHA1 domain-containing protein [Candidatus Thermoplasmatota archaeon]